MRLNKIKLNKNYFVAILILLLPFIDMYKSVVGNKIEIMSISLVEVINLGYTLAFTALFFGIVIFNRDKLINWKFILCAISVFTLYLIGHLMNISKFNEDLLVTTNINWLVEIYHIIISYIFPIVILYIVCNLDLDIRYIAHIFLWVGLVISCIIVITNLLEISYVSYGSSYENHKMIEGNIFSWGKKLGQCKDINLYTSKGLFYSANQMSAILSGVTFVTALLVFEKNKVSYYFYLLLDYVALLMLSTKTALLCIFFSISAILVYPIYIYIRKRKIVFKKKSIIISVILGIVMISLYLVSPVRYKIAGYVSNATNNKTSCEIVLGTEQGNLDNSNEQGALDIAPEIKVEFIENQYSTLGIPREYIELYDVDKHIDFWTELIKKNYSEVSNYRTVKKYIYQDVLLKNKNIVGDLVWGIGYTSGFPNLERDVLAQNIYYGYAGTAILVIPYFIILFLSIIRIVLNANKYDSPELYGFILAAAYIVLASVYTGHVFGMFVPNTFLAIMLGVILSFVRRCSRK